MLAGNYQGILDPCLLLPTTLVGACLAIMRSLVSVDIPWCGVLGHSLAILLRLYNLPHPGIQFPTHFMLTSWQLSTPPALNKYSTHITRLENCKYTKCAYRTPTCGYPSTSLFPKPHRLYIAANFSLSLTISGIYPRNVSHIPMQLYSTRCLVPR